MPRAPRQPANGDAHGMIPAKYLPVIISAVISAVVGGGGAMLNSRQALDPITEDVTNLQRDMDALRDKIDVTRELTVKHESQVPALEKRMDTSDARTTDALRAINQQLDYVLKNVANRR